MYDYEELEVDDCQPKSVQLIPDIVDVGGNAQLGQLIDSSQVAKVSKTMTQHIERGRTLVIPEKLTVKQVETLMTKYSHFDVRFLHITPNNHAFAAAHSKFELAELERRIGFNPKKSYLDQYGNPIIYYTDIGGNFSHAVNRDLEHVHYDSPILDLVDQNRFTNRMETLKKMELNQKLSLNQLLKINQVKQAALGNPTPDSYVCLGKAQNCNKKSEFGLAIHSLYDVKMMELGDMMDAKGINTVLATLVFDPKVFCMSEGRLEDLGMVWEMDGTKDNICFYFEKDSSFTYKHKFSTYMAWFMFPVFESSKGNTFAVEFMEKNFGVQYIKINRITNRLGVVASEPIIARRWTELDDYMVLRWNLSWVEDWLRAGQKKKFLHKSLKLDTGQSEKLAHLISTGDTIEKIFQRAVTNGNSPKSTITIMIPKPHYNKLMSYALDATQNRFVYSQIYSYFRSIKMSIIVGKDVITFGDDTDPRIDYIVAGIVYLSAWSFKYNQGLELHAQMKDIEFNREMGRAGFFTLIINYIFGCRDNSKLVGGMSSLKFWLYKKVVKQKVVEHALVQTPPKYFDVVQHKFFELYYNEHKNDVISNSPLICSSFTDKFLMESLQSAKSVQKPLKTDIVNELVPDYNITVRPKFVPLDVIVKLADAKKEKLQDYFLQHTVVEIEFQHHDVVYAFLRKLNHIKIVVPEEMYSVSGLLKLRLAFQNRNLIERGDRKENYTDLCKRVVEMYLDTLEDALTIDSEQVAELRVVPYATGQDLTEVMYSREIEWVKNKRVPPSRRVGVRRSNAANKLDQMDTAFNSKLLKLLPSTTAVDICAGPGSWSNLLIEKNNVGSSYSQNNIISCSLPNNGNMTNCVEAEGYSKFDNRIRNFDLTNPEHASAFVSYIKNNSKKFGVELVLADGGISGDYPDQEDRFLELLQKEIAVTKAVLYKGGRCVLKVYIGENNTVNNLLSRFSTDFRRTYLFKPADSNLANAEVYFIGLDYQPVVDHEALVDKVYVGIQNYVSTFNARRIDYILRNAEPDILPDDDKDLISKRISGVQSSPEIGVEVLADDEGVSISESPPPPYDSVVRFESEADLSPPVETLNISDYLDGVARLFKLPSYSLEIDLIDGAFKFVGELNSDFIRTSKSLDPVMSSLSYVNPRGRSFSSFSDIPDIDVPTINEVHQNSTPKLTSITEIQEPVIHYTIRGRGRSLSNEYLYVSPRTGPGRGRGVRRFKAIVEAPPMSSGTVHPEQFDDAPLSIPPQTSSCESTPKRRRRRRRNLSNVSLNSSTVSLAPSESDGLLPPIRTTILKPKSLSSLPSSESIELKFKANEAIEPKKPSLLRSSWDTLTSIVRGKPVVETVKVVVDKGEERKTVFGNVMRMKRNNGCMLQFPVDTALPPLKQLVTPGDGSCFFHAVSGGMIHPDKLRLMLLKHLDESTILDHKPDTKELCRRICSSSTEWGSTDLIDVFVDMIKNICVVEIFDYCIVIHGDSTADIIRYVYYKDNHFSLVIEDNSIYGESKLDLTIDNCDRYTEFGTMLEGDIWKSVYTAECGIANNAVVVHYRSIPEVMERTSKHLKGIFHKSGTGPLVYIELGDESDGKEYDTALLVIEIERHLMGCDCGPVVRRNDMWFHSPDAPVLKFDCAKNRQTITSDDISYCDIIIQTYEEERSLVGSVLRMDYVGDKTFRLALPDFQMCDNDVTRLVVDTVKKVIKSHNMLNVFTLGLDAEYNVAHFPVYNAFNRMFTTVYFKAKDSPVIDSRVFRANFVVGDTPAIHLYNAAVEIRELWRVTVYSIHDTCHTYYRKVKSDRSLQSLARDCDYTVGVFSVTTAQWIKKPPAGVKYTYGYGVNEETGAANIYDVTDLWTDELRPFLKLMADRNVIYIIVHKKTEKFLEARLYNLVSGYKLFMDALQNIKVEVVEGVPGAGKTHYILTHHRFSKDTAEIVLTATRSAAADLRKRVVDMHGAHNQKLLNIKYTTVESALLNSFKYSRVDTIFFDEAFLKHKGACTFVALLLEAKRVVFVGDAAQIPYADRNNNPVNHASIVPMIPSLPSENREFLAVSRRSPLDVAHLINKHLYKTNNLGAKVAVYSKPMLTTNPIDRSMKVVKINGIMDVKVYSADHYLVFTQQEKWDLKKYLKAENVNTINEFQGQQANNIVCVRLRGRNDIVFSDTSQVLTGVSRHRTSFVYATVQDADLLATLIYKVKEEHLNMAYRAPNAGGGYVYNSARTRGELEKRLMPRLGAMESDPSHKLELTPDYSINLNDEDKTLVKVCVNNFDGGGYRGVFPRPVSVIPYRNILPPLLHEPEPVLDPLNAAQVWMDTLRPGSTLIERKTQAIVFENSDLVISCRDFRIAAPRAPPVISDTMTPRLRTPCPPRAHTSQKSVLKAFNERNGVLEPLITAIIGPTDHNNRWNNFCHSYFKDGFESVLKTYAESPIVPNVDTMTNWLTTQPPAVLSELIALESTNLNDSVTNKFSYMLKNSAKPKLDPAPELELASPQAIAFQSKLMNSLFCPAVVEIKRRFQYLLSDNKIVYTDMSVSDFEEILTHRFGADLVKKVKQKLEIDFSKYDKSQLLDALEFEVIFMRAMGLSEQMINIWIAVHRRSELINYKVYFKAWTVYQRKSGDAMTFLGNTVFLMMVLSELIGVAAMKDAFALFAGDDSLIFMFKELKNMETIVSRSTAAFNLEMKLIDSKTYYFCSRFLVYSDKDFRWYIVPDVLKALIKLGRNDVVSVEHAKEYQISLRDNWGHYGDPLIYPLIDICMYDRYNVTHSCEHLYRTLWSIANLKDFSKLFFEWKEGDIPPVVGKLPYLD